MNKKLFTLPMIALSIISASYTIASARTPAEVFGTISANCRNTENDDHRDKYRNIGTVQTLDGLHREYPVAPGSPTTYNATKLFDSPDKNNHHFCITAANSPFTFTEEDSEESSSPRSPFTFAPASAGFYSFFGSSSGPYFSRFRTSYKCLDNFFALLYHNNIRNLVVLGNTDPDEWGRFNILPYFYPVGNPLKYDTLESYQKDTRRTYNVESEAIPSAERSIRRFTMSIQPTESEDKYSLPVHHFWNWKDGELPEDKDALEQFIKQFENTEGETVVHCSAGVGRTGLFIACLSALRTDMHNPEQIVKHLRDHRTNMVQTSAQFDYVCKFIIRNVLGVKIDWDAKIDYDEYFK